jgi:hypothetical protein
MLNYYKRFVYTFWKDFKKSTGEQVIGALLVIAILVLQIHYGIIKPGEIQPNAQAIGWPYAALVGVFFIIHLIRAPWKLDVEHNGRHRDHETKIMELQAFKAEVEAKEVYLEPSNPLCSVSLVSFNDGWGPRDCLRATFTNIRKPGIPGKIARKVAARITYFDPDRSPFTLDGRWARTTQPAAFSQVEDKTDILRVDFYPGTQHELDIANKLPNRMYSHAVAYDDLEARMLIGPIVKVKIELIAEHVCQIVECAFETYGDKLVALND